MSVIKKIGELMVGVSFRQDRQSKKALTGLGRTMQSLQSSAMKLGATMAGAFAAGNLISSIRQTANELDNLAKTANKLGILPERLTGLRHAAVQSGVAVQTLDMALQRATRRISEAAQGTGEAVKGLQELGLSATALEQLPLSERMYAIADAMAGVQSKSDRLRLAFKLFDSEGAALVNMLEGGSDALRDFQAEAEALGMVFSAEELAKVEAMNDALDEFSKAWEGIKGELVIAIAPEAASAITDLTWAIKNFPKSEALTGPAAMLPPVYSYHAARWLGGHFGRGRELLGRAVGTPIGESIGRQYAGPVTGAERRAFVGVQRDTLSRIGPQTGRTHEPFAQRMQRHRERKAAERQTARMLKAFRGIMDDNRRQFVMWGRAGQAMLGTVLNAGAGLAAPAIRDVAARNRDFQSVVRRPPADPVMNRVMIKGTAEAFQDARRQVRGTKSHDEERLKLERDAARQRDRMATSMEDMATAIGRVKVVSLL